MQIVSTSESVAGNAVKLVVIQVGWQVRNGGEYLFNEDKILSTDISWVSLVHEH